MSWWTDIRDTVESVGSLVGNYLLPGSGLVTQNLVSEGAQEQLGSPLGQLAMLGTGAGGAWQGNLGNYGNLWDSISGSGASAAPSLVEDGLYGTAANGASLVEDGLYGGSGGGNMLSNLFNSPLQTLGNLGKGAMGSNGSSGNTGWLSPVMSVGSGLYGMYLAEQQKKQAKLADPWGLNGGRGQAADQLQGLMNDPSTITSMPGWAASMQAVQRKMGTMPGSGAMMAELASTGGKFYNDTLQTLAGLAGTGNASLPLQSNAQTNSLTSSSLGSIGYGMSPNNQINPALLAALQKLGNNRTT